MRKSNLSRSFSNRRAVVPERNLVVVHNKHKHNMKMTEVLCELNVAEYQARKRYTQNYTEPIPKFVYSVMTAPQNFESQSSSETTVSSISSNYQKRLLNSSFKDTFERVMMEYERTILKESPKDAMDWQYATGGVIPYGKV